MWLSPHFSFFFLRRTLAHKHTRKWIYAEASFVIYFLFFSSWMNAERLFTRVDGIAEQYRNKKKTDEKSIVFDLPLFYVGTFVHVSGTRWCNIFQQDNSDCIPFLIKQFPFDFLYLILHSIILLDGIFLITEQFRVVWAQFPACNN